MSSQEKDMSINTNSTAEQQNLLLQIYAQYNSSTIKHIEMMKLLINEQDKILQQKESNTILTENALINISKSIDHLANIQQQHFKLHQQIVELLMSTKSGDIALPDISTMPDLINAVSKETREPALQQSLPPEPQPPETLPENLTPPMQPVQQTEMPIEESTIKNLVIDIVCQRTGYTPDMINIDMDLEAELGVESIMRADILTKLAEKNPKIHFDPDDFDSISTIADIIQLTIKSSADNK